MAIRQFHSLNFTNRGIYTCSQRCDGPCLPPDDTYAMCDHASSTAQSSRNLYNGQDILGHFGPPIIPPSMAPQDTHALVAIATDINDLRAIHVAQPPAMTGRA